MYHPHYLRACRIPDDNFRTILLIVLAALAVVVLLAMAVAILSVVVMISIVVVEVFIAAMLEFFAIVFLVVVFGLARVLRVSCIAMVVQRTISAYD